MILTMPTALQNSVIACMSRDANIFTYPHYFVVPQLSNGTHVLLVMSKQALFASESNSAHLLEYPGDCKVFTFDNTANYIELPGNPVTLPVLIGEDYYACNNGLVSKNISGAVVFQWLPHDVFNEYIDSIVDNYVKNWIPTTLAEFQNMRKGGQLTSAEFNTRLNSLLLATNSNTLILKYLKELLTRFYARSVELTNGSYKATSVFESGVYAVDTSALFTDYATKTYTDGKVADLKTYTDGLHNADVESISTVALHLSELGTANTLAHNTLQSNIDAVDTLVDNLGVQFTDFKNSVTYKDSTAINTAITALNNHANSLEQSVGTNTQNITGLTDRVGSLEGYTGNLDDHINAVDQSVVAAHQDITGLTNTVGAINTHLMSVDQGVAANAQSMANLSTEVAAVKTIAENNTDTLIHCKAFGCKADGTTDDTANLQAAINSVQTSGGILYLDKGTYLVTSRLVITQPLHIMGAGIGVCTINYRNATFHPEIVHDETWWEESNAAISIQTYHVTLEGFELNGGDSKANASPSNGIIMHWTKTKEDLTKYYDGAQRVTMNTIKIKGFKSGIFFFGGWNRYIYCCQITDCTDAGIKYFPLQLSTTGHWAASGDVILACQLVGNTVGYYAQCNFESTVWNTVFEYNGNAISVSDCKDIIFKNCWNEANTGNVLVAGSCKFEGGYNITPETCTHTIQGNDYVQFESKDAIYWVRGTQKIFVQENGVITKGIELGATLDNLFTNPGFKVASGGDYIPGLTSWNKSGSFIATNTKSYEAGNFVVYGKEVNHTSDPGYGIYQDVHAIFNKAYTLKFKALTPDRATLDKGIRCHVYFYNSNGDVTTAYRNTYTFVGNEVWEEFSFSFTTIGTTDHFRVELGVVNNGEIYISNPQVFLDDGVVKSSVAVRNEESQIKFLDQSGAVINSFMATAPLAQQYMNTFTPTVYIDSTLITDGTRWGNYVRIGNLVFINIFISTRIDSNTGVLRIKDIPHFSGTACTSQIASILELIGSVPGFGKPSYQLCAGVLKGFKEIRIFDRETVSSQLDGVGMTYTSNQAAAIFQITGVYSCDLL